MPNLLIALVLAATATVAGMLPPNPAHHASRPRDHATVHAARTATTRSAYVNPLAGRPWGVYEGAQEMAWQPYVNATGNAKRLLGYIALAPKAKWFGQWISDDAIAGKVSDYISNAQAGDPATLVQMTIFRVVPWEDNACSRLPTTAERASYKRWIRSFAGAVGSAHTAIVLQPDGPFALCAPGGSTVPSRLVSYAAKILSALPNTSVYIEAGAADWPHAGAQGGVSSAVKILVRGGIRYAHGFALDTTHYDSMASEINRAAAISRALTARGYAGRHAVINTAGNGHPWEYGAYTGRDANNPRVCTTVTPAASVTCETLGIPPTSDVGSPTWKLGDALSARARKYVDAYLWVGRPWLYRDAEPFVKKRALALVRSTPWR